MYKKIAGLVGAISGLMSLTSAQATTVPPSAGLTSAQSFGELLDPIPNAAALLRFVDAAGLGRHDQTGAKPNVKLAYDHHHHHHKYHHHHHHHHHYHHHHHHHHHHHY